MRPDVSIEKTLEATDAAIELWIGRRLAAGEFEDESSARSAFWRTMRVRKDGGRHPRERCEAMDLTTAVAALTKAAEGRGEALVLAGGFAYGVHAEPRATVDIDLMILESACGDRIEAAMRDVFDSVYVNRETMEYSRVRVRRYLGITGTKETIVDLLEPLDSRFSRRIAERALPIDFKSARLQVVSREDLYLLKAVSEREQDRLDAKRLAEAPDFDWSYVGEMERILP